MPHHRGPHHQLSELIRGAGWVLLLLALAGCGVMPTPPPAWEPQVLTVQPGAATAAAQTAQAAPGTLPPAQSAAPTAAGQPQPKTPAAGLTPAAPEPGIAVWFTDPLAHQTRGGPETHLIQAIDAAQRAVDMAIYNLTLPAMGDALIRARQRGVTVRIVMESEAMDKSLPQKLIRAGFEIVGDQREGLMHDKFTVIDGREVWTGSLNYAESSAYNDFNNLVRIVSPEVVADYQAEFEQMFTQHRFGPDKAPVAPYPDVSVGRIPVQVYFSPEDGAAKHVTAELNRAQKSIVFMAYSFTRDDFSQAMRARAKAGVAVRGVFDEDQVQSNQGGEYAVLKKAGIPVRLDGIPGLLHDKVMIIDEQVVITGSYNFSSNAERVNDDNLIIIHDPAIAAQYLRQFEAIYASSKK